MKKGNEGKRRENCGNKEVVGVASLAARALIPIFMLAS